MAIANDANVSQGGNSQTTSAALNHAANVLIVIFISINSNPALTVSSVTVGGANVTLLQRKNTLWSGMLDTEIWYIFRASAANETVQVTLSGTPGGGGGVAWTAASFTGTATSSPFFKNTADNRGESNSVSVTVSGQIRDDPDDVLRLEELRVRADNVDRALDLEDGSASINAKLGNVEATWDVERGVDRVAFQAAFYETS